MNALVRYAGWVVAVLGIVIAALLGRQLQEARTERDAVVAQLSNKNHQIEELLKLEELAKKQAEENRLMLESMPSSDHIEDQSPEPELEEDANPAFPLEQSPTAPSFFGSIAQMMKGEKGAALARNTAQAQAQMSYGALFRELNLPPDVEGRAIDIVASAMEEEMLKGMDMLTGKTVDGKEAKKEHDAALIRVRADLSKILSADELARYDEFQADLPRHNLEQQYEMQLTMFNSSLPQESRDLIVQTLTEEALTLMPDFGKPGWDAGTGPSEVFDAQITAIDRARERLAGEMDETQYAQAERFLAQQQQQALLFRDMFGNLMPPSNAKPK